MKDIESRLHKDLAGTLGPLSEGAETPLYTLAEIKKRAQVMREGYRAKVVNVPEVAVTEETITSGGRDMVIRLYQPAEGETPKTGVLLLHGGGLVYGADRAAYRRSGGGTGLCAGSRCTLSGGAQGLLCGA